MYQFSSRIRFSETDEHNRLDAAGLLDYFQDCATFHSGDIGLSGAVLRSRGMFWVLSSWQVILYRLPSLGDRVEVITNPYDFKGCFGRRNFRLDTAEGETLAIADSLWTLVSTESGAPVHICQEDMEKYQPGAPFDMDYAGRKIKITGEESGCFDPVPVSRHMLDCNGHVNNTQYVRLAEEYLPGDFAYRQLRVEYKKAALLGDTLHVKRYAGDGRITVQLADGAGKPYVTVEFTA